MVSDEELRLTREFLARHYVQYVKDCLEIVHGQYRPGLTLMRERRELLEEVQKMSAHIEALYQQDRNTLSGDAGSGQDVRSRSSG